MLQKERLKTHLWHVLLLVVFNIQTNIFFTGHCVVLLHTNEAALPTMFLVLAAV